MINSNNCKINQKKRLSMIYGDVLIQIPKFTLYGKINKVLNQTNFLLIKAFLGQSFRASSLLVILNLNLDLLNLYWSIILEFGPSGCEQLLMRVGSIREVLDISFVRLRFDSCCQLFLLIGNP